MPLGLSKLPSILTEYTDIPLSSPYELCSLITTAPEVLSPNEVVTKEPPVKFACNSSVENSPSKLLKIK